MDEIKAIKLAIEVIRKGLSKMSVGELNDERKERVNNIEVACSRLELTITSIEVDGVDFASGAILTAQIISLKNAVKMLQMPNFPSGGIVVN